MTRNGSMSRDTIFALSSGRPPAAIAMVRVSGPDAGTGLRRMAVSLPAPRRAVASLLRHPDTAEILDHGLVLWMPGPNSATGEDVAELHVHGGRAVVDAVLAALASLPGHRPAHPGEFTRRAFDNGCIDLNEAEGLADLLAAETDAQRRAALLAAGGGFSRQIERWRERLLAAAASAEAEIDYAEDVEDVTRPRVADMALGLAADIATALAQPPAERLRNGIRVVFAGPPNAGKSTLINTLADREAAIVSPIAGTTRDVIEVPLILDGLPVILVDTAGLREAGDAIEQEGVARAAREVAGADILVWLGMGAAPAHDEIILISPQADHQPLQRGRLAVSAKSGLNLCQLRDDIVERCSRLLPPEGSVALNARQRALADEMQLALEAAASAVDPIIQAEELRAGLALCDRLAGRSGVEDMLDALFGSFCLGK